MNILSTRKNSVGKILMLRIEHVRPFIDSVRTTIEMMLGSAPTMMRPYLKGDHADWGDISGIIGFAGEKLVGSVALSLPANSAKIVYQKMVGEEVSDLNSEVQDSIGELVNIIAGNGKTALSAIGLHFDITIPSVIVGDKHVISYKADEPILVMPFAIDDHPFALELLLKILNK